MTHGCVYMAQGPCIKYIKGTTVNFHLHSMLLFAMRIQRLYIASCVIHAVQSSIKVNKGFFN